VRRLSILCLLLSLLIPTMASAAPVIDAPATLDCGHVPVMTSANVTLTVANTGNVPLTVFGLSISGSEFSFPTPPPSNVNLAPGGSWGYTVRFSPTSFGSKSGSVTLNSNDPVTPSKVVSLSGLGSAPVITTSVSTLEFGNVNALSSGDQSFYILNDGTMPLFVTGFGFSGTDASSFGFAGTPPASNQTLPPGQTLNFTLRFSPGSAGAKSAAFTINSNDPFQPSKSVPLHGTGIGPMVTTTPGALSFGAVHVDQYGFLALQVGNGGGGTLSITNLSFTGAEAGSFSLFLAPTLPIDLVSGGSVLLTVRFEPSTIGGKMASLEIASNDAATPLAIVPLSGTAIRPEPVIAGVRDVPNDQGGRVRLSWDASTFDTQQQPLVDHYWIFRSVAAQAALAPGAQLHAIDGRRLERSRFYTSRFNARTYYWELLTEVRALHVIEGYSFIASTLGDSTPAYNPLTLFMVMALDAGNTLHWDSAPDSGYSADNLAPDVPASLTGNYWNGATYLHWSRSGEGDLAGYRIYRGSTADFVPSAANLVGSPPDTGFADAGDAGGHYKLSAVDRHGNESVFALLTPAGTLDAPGNGSLSLALARPSPNPAPGAVELGFTLPAAGDATLEIYDGQGRRVGTVVNGTRPAGRQSVRWTGRDDHGRNVPEGVYFARLVVARRTLTTRFAILR